MRVLPGFLCLAVVMTTACSADTSGLGSGGNSDGGGEGSSGSSSGTTQGSGTSTSQGTESSASMTGDPTASSSESNGSESTSGNPTSGDPTTGDPTTGGGGPNVQISDGPSFEFGIVDVGATDEHEFVVSNMGDAPATMLMPQALAAPFSTASTTCGDQLDANESCEIVVAFDPVEFGSRTETLTVEYGPGPNSASVDVRAAGGGTTEELVVNGGGEDGGAPPMGWTEVAGDAWSAADFSGSGIPSHSGNNSIFPGQDNPSTHELAQDIDVSAHAAAIDADEVRFDFSGWGRSWFASEDEYRFIVEFRDDDSQLGGDMVDTDWQLGTTWAEYTGTGKAPTGTRVVRVRLLCDLVNSFCDSFFDDVSLTATYEP